MDNATLTALNVNIRSITGNLVVLDGAEEGEVLEVHVDMLNVATEEARLALRREDVFFARDVFFCQVNR